MLRALATIDKNIQIYGHRNTKKATQKLKNMLLNCSQTFGCAREQVKNRENVFDGNSTF